MTYEDLEDTCIAALNPLLNEGLKTLKSYGGEFSPDSFGQFSIKFPAVMVCVAGLTNDAQGNTDLQDREVVIYVAARDLRGEDDARHGAYHTMEQARGQLNRLRVAGAGRLTLKSESLVGYSRKLNLCVMQATYRLKVQQPVS
jgi:phage gp37-like protein